MKFQKIILVYLVFFTTNLSYALETHEILVIANSDIPESVQLAKYYCKKRAVPKTNILTLALGKKLRDNISRTDYEQQLAVPIRNKIYRLEFDAMLADNSRNVSSGPSIKCLLTTYGVPIKVGKRGKLNDKKQQLKKLNELLKQETDHLRRLESNRTADFRDLKIRIKRNLRQLESTKNQILGKETHASVDSELSLVLFNNYELYRWQPNRLKKNRVNWDLRSLMVCRLDGPGFQIAKGLIDKAISAEKNGLKGIAYLDSGHSMKNKNKPAFTKFDLSLWDLAAFIKSQTELPIVEERTTGLFAPGDCPSAAIYCGWYSLKNYIDAFDFVDGAIGYHIASFEAVDLRDPNSTQWCPAMLKDGVTATLGAVAEPYLQAFPMPDEFFKELVSGYCLVEAYYYTKPFNSWQLILVGDPLYKPFKKSKVTGSSLFFK